MFAANFEIKFKGVFKKQKQIQKIYEKLRYFAENTIHCIRNEIFH